MRHLHTESSSGGSPCKCLRSSNICFRYGFAGHMPAECKAETTCASQPVVSLILDPLGRNKHILIGPSNRPFCIIWAQDSFCSYNDKCCNVHSCTLCGSTSWSKPVQITQHAPSDPRQVVTPINTIKTEALLHSLNLFYKWSHVIVGLQNGFDVGIYNHSSHTMIFDNHASSRLDPDFISSYIKGEESAGH